MEPAKKTPKNKKKIIFIVAAVALLAGCLTGAYLWHSQVQELKANRDSSQQKIDQLEKQIKEISKNDISSNTTNQKFLEIKEWGINLEFDKAYQVSYTLSKDGTAQAASFTIKDSSVDTSSCINQTKDLGVSLVRTNTKTDDMHGTPVKIGSYYYYVSGSPYICNADVDKDNAPRNIIVSQLNKALTNFLRE